MVFPFALLAQRFGFLNRTHRHAGTNLHQIADDNAIPHFQAAVDNPASFPRHQAGMNINHFHHIFTIQNINVRTVGTLHDCFLRHDQGIDPGQAFHHQAQKLSWFLNAFSDSEKPPAA